MTDEKNLESFESEEQARRYNRIKRRFQYAQLALGLVYLLLFIFTDLTFGVRDAGARISSNYYIQILIYFALFMLLFELLTLPLSVISGFFVERRFDLLRQSGLSWTWDYIKSTVLGLVLGGAAMELLYLVIKRTGEWWWVAAGTVFAFCFFLLAQLTPVLILPLFYKFKPLAQTELDERLTRLCERARTKVRGIYEWGLSAKTREANAALMGWGMTRRVVISDTLLNNFEPAEVEVILAHELGHHRLRHLPRLMVIQIFMTFLTFAVCDWAFRVVGPSLGFESLQDIAGMPLLALIFFLIGFLALPAINMYSRKLERAADRYAIEFTGLAKPFASAMNRLAGLNLAEAEPHPFIEFLFHSHPSPAKRVQSALNYSSGDTEPAP
ncbi:MAG: M48 family metallopeptidase [Deltaproteobacteria bacterium]|nr:M48 family metallopeptidase [Deltaproteobacteria bacterium]